MSAFTSFAQTFEAVLHPPILGPLPCAVEELAEEAHIGGYERSTVVKSNVSLNGSLEIVPSVRIAESKGGYLAGRDGCVRVCGPRIVISGMVTGAR